MKLPTTISIQLGYEPLTTFAPTVPSRGLRENLVRALLQDRRYEFRTIETLASKLELSIENAVDFLGSMNGVRQAEGNCKLYGLMERLDEC